MTTKHERDIEWVTKELGCEPPRVCGWKIAVKVWYSEFLMDSEGRFQLDADGEKIPWDEGTQFKQKMQSITGTVIGIGPLAFQDKAFRGTRLCEVGDYIQYKMRDSYPFQYGPGLNDKVTIRLIDDIAVGLQLEDPSDVTLC